METSPWLQLLGEFRASRCRLWRECGSWKGHWVGEKGAALWYPTRSLHQIFNYNVFVLPNKRRERYLPLQIPLSFNHICFVILTLLLVVSLGGAFCLYQQRPSRYCSTPVEGQNMLGTGAVQSLVRALVAREKDGSCIRRIMVWPSLKACLFSEIVRFQDVPKVNKSWYIRWHPAPK